jgi:hypothetical protein
MTDYKHHHILPAWLTGEQVEELTDIARTIDQNACLAITHSILYDDPEAEHEIEAAIREMME